MKIKLQIVAFVVMILALVFSVSQSFAFDHSKGKMHAEGLDSKFFSKAHFIIQNQEELKLSDEQVGKIKDLKLSTKRGLIKIDAEIELIALDIKAQLMQDSIDTEAINALIDQKYELKKIKTKSLIASYAALKNSLSAEQKKALKKLKKMCNKK